MHICFITYEYPPDTGIGGIATYVFQVANAFAAKKISTDVICGSPLNSDKTEMDPFLTVTKIKCNSVEEFRTLSPKVAYEIHSSHPFDLIEVPEYGAEGLYIKNMLPGVPLIVKLHTPRYLMKELNNHYYKKTTYRKVVKTFSGKYDFREDKEYQAIHLADHIISPSLSLREIVSEKWGIEKNRIIHVPNPFFPSPEFLNIPIENAEKNVLYIGRLETRKGVLNLAKAIPHVVKKIPDAKFIFLGKDGRGPAGERSMKKVLLDQLKHFANNVTFIDHVSSNKVAEYCSWASICVFPSLWENFPNVCLEAMSAARPVVASAEGGMNEMLPDAKANMLVDPHDPVSIADGIVHALLSPHKKETALANRQKIIDFYSAKVVENIIAAYSSFILESANIREKSV